MNQSAERLADLPSDTLLQIFNECDVLDVLNLSSTCRRLQQVADEYQVWLGQARGLHIPIPPGTNPSKAQLKDWVVSRAKAEVCWVKNAPGSLIARSFEMETNFVDAHLIPGGDFIVIYYATAHVTLNKIVKSFTTGEILEMREVARCEGTNELDHPGSWSRLLTETSYGCPVLVTVGASLESHPSIFLIDPVSQVIEKKECMHCDLDNLVMVQRILAVGDAVFFVCEDFQGSISVTVIMGSSGPYAVTKALLLKLPRDGDHDEPRVFAVSEHGLLVANRSGIFLYHVPGLGSNTPDFTLYPVWEWAGNASYLRGTHYKAASPFPALWLQGGLFTHTLEFDEDESGFPVVTKHEFTGGRPAFRSAEHIKLRGRKGMSIEQPLQGQIVIKTGVLEKPDVMRRLNVSLPGLTDCPQWGGFMFADLDELTGRIMIVVGPPISRRFDNILCARQLYVVDLVA